MSDLNAAAEAMGVPAPIVERSARAKAAETGQSYEAVITAWAGGETIDAPSPAPAATAPSETPEETAPPASTEAPLPVQPSPQPQVAAAAAVPRPTPERVSPDEALEYPVVVTVPTAGITERTGFSMPVWLSMLLLVIPAFGLLYLAMGASAECGTGTALRVDRVSGEMENCDGTAFEGRGPAGGGVDYIAMGQTDYATCAGCHGPQGQGIGTFPALTGVLTTFGSCTDHIEWVQLGTAGFQGAGMTTYGDTNKPVGGGGVMPGFAASLSEEQIAAVVAFERVRIGGGNPDEVLADCGLAGDAEGEEGEGTDTTGGATTDTMAESTTDTTGAPEAAASP